jgi:hypothetical protein
MFYGKRQMFRPDFMDWFEALRLPPYHLERVGDQYELTFEGPWPEVDAVGNPGARGADGASGARGPAPAGGSSFRCSMPAR